MKMRIVLLAALLLAVIVFLACQTHQRGLAAQLLIADPDAIPNNATLMRFALPLGARTFSNSCAKCHGQSLKADPVHGIPDLTDADWLFGSGKVAEIERVIAHGIRSGAPRRQDLADMPAYATPRPYRRYDLRPLSPRDIDDLASFLLSFHDPKQDGESVAHGRELYSSSERGGCFDCHGMSARGDSSIGAPNLTDSVWLYGDGSRTSIARSIAFGRAGACPGWAGTLSPLEMRATALYVHSRSKEAIQNDTEK